MELSNPQGLPQTDRCIGSCCSSNSSSSGMRLTLFCGSWCKVVAIGNGGHLPRIPMTQLLISTISRAQCRKLCTAAPYLFLKQCVCIHRMHCLLPIFSQLKRICAGLPPEGWLGTVADKLTMFICQMQNECLKHYPYETLEIVMPYTALRELYSHLQLTASQRRTKVSLILRDIRHCQLVRESKHQARGRKDHRNYFNAA
ncbi:putative X-ORF protein [Etapapillomavirus 1]|uniref:Putative X-ORF protein n=1 Tax=Fringilla coelebs papillomavirus (isolate Chaffinch/Netherlands/Dutch) TaxID=654914 RepID=Q8JNA5_FCPVN|nr:putative X-ORF protein [Etapapillomavirus 1]AAL14227.1 putative X-ORF protein [Etapapillomavirus 1]